MQQIYKFQPYYKTVIWGGTRIAALKGVELPHSNVGESWELSSIEGKESVVGEGPEAGLTLGQLVEKYGAPLIGEGAFKVYGARFPLLVKYIDANSDLSVQAHPTNELTMRKYGTQEGKTEMWYVVEAKPDAKIYAGLNKRISPDDFKRMAQEGNVMEVVEAHESKAGKSFFLPAGRVHAIGSGNLVVEIQQPSDITYRIYDYGRRDENGQMRELHLDQAIEAIDFDNPFFCECDMPESVPPVHPLVRCNLFDVDLVELEGSLDLPIGASFKIIMCIDGTCQLQAGADTVALSRGETALVAAQASLLNLEGQAKIITAQLPEC